MEQNDIDRSKLPNTLSEAHREIIRLREREREILNTLLSASNDFRSAGDVLNELSDMLISIMNEDGGS